MYSKIVNEQLYAPYKYVQIKQMNELFPFDQHKSNTNR